MTTTWAGRVPSAWPTSRRFERVGWHPRCYSATTTLPPPHMSYPRDLVGYAQRPPHADWPGGARLALQIVMNWEEGGERSILHGDEFAETYRHEVPGTAPVAGARNLPIAMERDDAAGREEQGQRERDEPLVQRECDEPRDHDSRLPRAGAHDT